MQTILPQIHFETNMSVNMWRIAARVHICCFCKFLSLLLCVCFVFQTSCLVWHEPSCLTISSIDCIFSLMHDKTERHRVPNAFSVKFYVVNNNSILHIFGGVIPLVIKMKGGCVWAKCVLHNISNTNSLVVLWFWIRCWENALTNIANGLKCCCGFEENVIETKFVNIFAISVYDGQECLLLQLGDIYTHTPSKRFSSIFKTMNN